MNRRPVFRPSGRAVGEYGSVRPESLRWLPRPALVALLRVLEAKSATASLEFPNRDYEGAQATAVPSHHELAKPRSRHPKSPESAVVREPFAARLSRWPHEDPGPVRGPRQGHEIARRPPSEATGHCRGVTSPERCQRQFPFPHRFCREPQGFRNVLALEIRMQRDNLVCGQALGHQLHYHRDGNAQSANTWSAAHLIGTDRDARKSHQSRVAPRNRGEWAATRLESFLGAGAFPSPKNEGRSGERQVALATPQDYKSSYGDHGGPIEASHVESQAVVFIANSAVAPPIWRESHERNRWPDDADDFRPRYGNLRRPGARHRSARGATHREGEMRVLGEPRETARTPQLVLRH